MHAISLGVAGTRTQVWTQPENAIVRASLDVERTFEAIRLELKARGCDHGLTSIVRLAHKMGVNRATMPWTDAEYALFRRGYAEKRPVREIATDIGRRVRRSPAWRVN